MIQIIRLVIAVVVVGIIIGLVSHFGGGRENDRPQAAEQAAAPTPTPSQSQATRNEDSTGTLISYSIVAGDALIIRLSGGDMTSCAFKIHAGPRMSSEHAEDGITVDYWIVPVTAWREEVKRLGQECDEYWSTID